VIQKHEQKDKHHIDNMKEKKSVELERKEALMRIIVGIISGIILYVWMYLVAVFFAINWVWVLISGKKIKEMVDISESWATQVYYFSIYMTFKTNNRPFPFSDLKSNAFNLK